MTDMESVCRVLGGQLAEAEVVLLSQDQILVRKHMVPTADLGGFKTAALVPASDGFAIYVSRLLPGIKDRPPQQRVSASVPPLRWDPAVTTLRLDRVSLDQNWEFLNQAGELIRIAAYCGSEQVFDEADRVLVLIAPLLLS